jgi:hypothetical protein
MSIGPIQMVPPTQTSVDTDAGARRLPFRSTEPKFTPSSPTDSPAPQQQPEQQPTSLTPEVPEHRISVNIDEAKQVYYQVIDQRSGEVIRQVPSEDVLRIARNIGEFLRTQAIQEKNAHVLDTKS